MIDYWEHKRIINKAERMIIRLRAVQIIADIVAMGIQPPNRKQAIKMARRLMCDWNVDLNRWGRVIYGGEVEVTYHPLKPTSELLIFGGK
jgi:hypothetical protein